jgi:hypothetical protein
MQTVHTVHTKRSMVHTRMDRATLTIIRQLLVLVHTVHTNYLMYTHARTPDWVRWAVHMDRMDHRLNRSVSIAPLLTPRLHCPEARRRKLPEL